MSRGYRFRALVPTLLIHPLRSVRSRFRQVGWADPYQVHYAAGVSVWARWLVAALLLYVLFHPPFPFPVAKYSFYSALAGLFVALNGLIHARLRAGWSPTWRWTLAVNVMDVTLITVGVWLTGGFHSLFLFLLYYPSLATFAVLFTSTRFCLTWTTLVALAYTGVCLTAADGIDPATRADTILLARVVAMYTVTLAVSMVVNFERSGRLMATERERALQRERIDLSQSIHDNTAQSVYMIGLGVDSARALTGDSNPELSETLAATSQLSRTVMWELRHSIDAGRIFEGRSLGAVLREHTETFQRITAVPTDMVQSGAEPELSVDVRSGLFSIAHNALTNAFRHSGANRVNVVLDFGGDRIRLTVEDDGVGLPGDYAQKGRGFAGMNSAAERMGGCLSMAPGKTGKGTKVTCEIPIAPAP